VAGTRLRPPVPAPPPLRPYLNFQKLPARALGAVRRVVEGDDDYRERVAAVATEELVGRSGWLWLHRPEGWEEELDAVVATESAQEAEEDAARSERTAARRLEAAEAATRRAVAALAAAESELTAEHTRRIEADSARSKVERRAQQLEVELSGARRRLTEAEQAVAAGEARAAAAEASAADAASRLAIAEGRRDEAEARARVAEAQLELSQRDAPEAVAPPGGLAPVADAEALADALREAGAALAAAARALEGPVEAPCPPHVTPGLVPPARRARRSPLRLPGGVQADSMEAALHLLRQPGILLVVDGYNAAKLGWPDLALPLQRERLLDALEELVARHRPHVRVVFDGADVTRLPSVRRGVRVEFSPPGVKADDVIVDLVEALPARQPVVVATNDGEVRQGARAGGANVISSDQLLAAARR
jgi:predicted RNA-binding protein with PIN domain